VVLYEIHEVERPRERPAPNIIPNEAVRRIRETAPEHGLSPEMVSVWTTRVLQENPSVAVLLRTAAAVAGVAAAMASLALILTPVIGDECLAGMAAAALIGYAAAGRSGTGG
jgi:hypothetical protein